jgi:ABC-type phosphate transport system permease subunit
MPPTRFERRQRRKRTEEIMSWILLPVIIVVVYFIGVVAWQNLREAIPALGDMRSIQERARR